MKFGLLLFIFLVSIISNSNARELTRLKDSHSLQVVLNFFYENREDFKYYPRLKDLKEIDLDTKECIKVSSREVLKEVKANIEFVFNKYPDEELPVEAALFDVEQYLAGDSFIRCTKEFLFQDKVIATIFYQSVHFHPTKSFRLDQIATSFGH